LNDFNLPEFLYEEGSFGVFVLVTLVMGGGAAWLAGRAIASTWRPWWHIVAYMLILALAVRFIHFALFRGTILTLHYYLVDATVCMILGFLGFRATRARQMTTQYRFLNRRTGLFSWERLPSRSPGDTTHPE
jgi:hypothetical protein